MMDQVLLISIFVFLWVIVISWGYKQRKDENGEGLKRSDKRVQQTIGNLSCKEVVCPQLS